MEVGAGHDAPLGLNLGGAWSGRVWILPIDKGGSSGKEATLGRREARVMLHNGTVGCNFGWAGEIVTGDGHGQSKDQGIGEVKSFVNNASKQCK